MLALAQAGLDIAPMPLGLIRDGLQHPAVVETWLAGPVSHEPPTIDREWEQLVRHLAQTHRVTPESCAVSLPAAVIAMTGTVSGLAVVTAEVERLRPSGVPHDVADLVRRMTAAPLPDVVGTAHCLCSLRHQYRQLRSVCRWMGVCGLGIRGLGRRCVRAGGIDAASRAPRRCRPAVGCAWPKPTPHAMTITDRLPDLRVNRAGALAGQRRSLVRAHELLDGFARSH
jgi:hypothetical protein